MKVQDDFPLDPTAIDSGVPINIVASRTFILIVLNGLVLLQNDAQLKNHAWLHTARKFRRTDGSGIFGMYHFICTPLHVVISVAILAIAFDDIIKSLTDRYPLSDGNEDRKNIYLPGGAKHCRDWDILPKMIYNVYCVEFDMI
jgi:hypothetical protein